MSLMNHFITVFFSFITSAKGGYVFGRVFWVITPSVCPSGIQYYLQSNEWICLKFSKEACFFKDNT